MKVLIVEDEQRLAGALCRGLQAEGYVVVHAGNGTEGLRQATGHDYDAVLLDIMLPGLDGYEMLRRMRAQQVWTPVLVLTANDEDDAQVKAFDLGADDYLTKPFSFTILVARLRALIRRGAPHRPMVLTAGSLSLDPARRVVERESTAIDLTPREYGLLEFLMRNKDAVVTKSEIRQNVWANQTGGDNAVEIYIGYLRRKIDLPFGTNTIQTVRGFGYRINSPASARSNSPMVDAVR
ncbi:response regulator transcription factor [Mycolicibacterium brisbanense]|uniref:Response regulator with CheY-like receiver domain and winged-helix DNA-binding domain n=1 Tax=Mycolicibacterium brisbanense TaxID=146020 RepID=A0A117I4P4_9MYCO|nr:response regulator transcription factor [Mycolicibacterium brisbanense]MCV7162281.1 response regulator transcription factor [Mycolicibacterium brisbanense]GAS87270.1 response regulator with CheY-like receiver domain and winged-helix DNA-binding domain [Mycolicibacterium brisbanense]